VNKEKVEFTNKECDKLLGLGTTPVTPRNFADIKENNSNDSLKDIMLDEKRYDDVKNKKFVYKSGTNEKKYFTIRHISIIFHNHDSTAFILQDETSFEELKTLDEKYQRIYLASVVHDIRTPVNGILGILENMECKISNPDIKKDFAVVRNTAQMLYYLTQDITDYSQSESKTLTPNNRKFSPSEIVSKCAQILERSFVMKDIGFHKYIDDNVPREIYSDPNRYMRILLNLVGNALKFTTKGSVTVIIRFSENEDTLVTRVIDTGIGIKEEDIPKLFKLFGKIRENDDINPTGVGLGLTICKKMCELLGGTIRAESEFGKGSVFTFTICCGLGTNANPSIISPSTIPFGWADERDIEANFQNDSRTFMIHASPLSQRALLKDYSTNVFYIFLYEQRIS